MSEVDVKSRSRRRRELALAVAILAGAIVAAFPGLLVGEVLFLRDTTVVFWPDRAFLAERISLGEIPTWDPRRHSGQPYLAHGGPSLLYPPQLLAYWLLPARFAFHLLPLVHLLAFGVGCHAWLRRVARCSRQAALTGALALTLSGFVLSSVAFQTQLYALAWLPPALLTLARIQRRGPTVRRVGMLALFLGAIGLSAVPYPAIVTGGFLVAQLLAQRRGRWRALGALVLAGIGSLALAAPQVLPTALHLPTAQRVVDKHHAIDKFPVSPVRLLELAVPRAFGDHARIDDLHEPAFGDARLFVSIHAGVVPLLALAGALAGGRRRAALLLLAVGVLLATTPLGAWLNLVPPMSLVRYRAKYMLLIAVGLALAVAFTVDALRRRPRATGLGLCIAGASAVLAAVGALTMDGPWEAVVRRWYESVAGPGPESALAAIRADLRWLAVFGLTTLVVGVAARAGRARLAAWSFTALVVLELGSFAASCNPTFPLASVREPGPIVDAIRAAEVQGRTWSSWDRPDRPLGYKDPSAFWESARAVRTAFPIAATPWGVRHAYDPDYTGMYEPPVRNLMAAGDPVAVRRLVDLGAITHVVASHEVHAPGVRHVLHDPFSAMHLYAVDDPLPELRVVGQAWVARSAERRETLALTGPFQPKEMTVIEVADGAAPVAEGRGRATLSMIEARANRVAVHVATESSCWLVWSQTPARGWSATLDGDESRWYRADLSALAVFVPAGEHVVAFAFWPPGLTAGLAASATAVLIFIGALFVEARRRRRSSER